MWSAGFKDNWIVWHVEVYCSSIYERLYYMGSNSLLETWPVLPRTDENSIQTGSGQHAVLSVDQSLHTPCVVIRTGKSINYMLGTSSLQEPFRWSNWLLKIEVVRVDCTHLVPGWGRLLSETKQ